VALKLGQEKLAATHDGVTAARGIALIDPFENTGAQLFKQAASHTS
jgi:hypothetical protein